MEKFLTEALKSKGQTLFWFSVGTLGGVPLLHWALGLFNDAGAFFGVV